MMMKVFVVTNGHAGHVFSAREVVKPDNVQTKEPTEWVICSPYRRVYLDEGGMYVIWKKRKTSVYLLA
jgi:hypothetical protein